ncbi:hypothetical protein [Rhizomicrobium electricum]|uniref:hypothetical protein n=1 Tax=Rhizomicrobium electricum TaxID=480070 RepID=UPI0014204103|nr:hypothetical protein [Rhizomicrobium electricum]NIJ47967.1 hypothetical protein [Rhizomicrobium electricum]
MFFQAVVFVAPFAGSGAGIRAGEGEAYHHRTADYIQVRRKPHSSILSTITARCFASLATGWAIVRVLPAILPIAAEAKAMPAKN